MIKTAAYITIIVLLFGGCKPVSDCEMPTERDYYEFINSAIKVSHKQTVYLLETASYDTDDMLIAMKYAFKNDSELFSMADKEYMLSQLKQPANLIWKQNKLKDKVVIKEKQSDSILKIKRFYVVEMEDKSHVELDVSMGYFMYSIPIFNINKTLCMFLEAYECGFMCGGGSFNLYKKVNSNWQKGKSYYSWVE